MTGHVRYTTGGADGDGPTTDEETYNAIARWLFFRNHNNDYFLLLRIVVGPVFYSDSPKQIQSRPFVVVVAY